jgi:hypothetical protein
MIWRPGDRVCQPTYGVGEVVQVSGNHVTVAFDGSGVRKFVVSMVQLTPSDAPRPERPEPKPRGRRGPAGI